MQTRELLATLSRGNVEFIIVGGIAAIAHGSARFTQDLDISYRRTPDNLRKLAQTLAPMKPYLRGVPPGLPFKLDPQTLESGLNFTLTTTMGDLDLLGEITGAGTYDEILPESIEVEVMGEKVRIVSLDCLIRMKKAAGRIKDIDALAELQKLAAEKTRLREERHAT